jgi:hypothetical protein
MSRKVLAACIAALTLTFIFSAVPANASSVSPQQTSMATFEGHTIDLSKGWGAATACVIWRSHGIAECFRTNAELASREAQVRPSAAVHTSGAIPDTSTCSVSLDLYSGRNYTGLHLSLIDEGYWQELSYYGFDNTTVSFLGGACSFHLAQGNFGQGYWYPGNTNAWSTAFDMGSWDDTVSSVYIN